MTLAAWAAWAAPAGDPLSTYFGNTLIGTAPNGKTARASLSRDGTFVGASPEGTAVKGKWNVEGGKLCFAVLDPKPPDPQPVCIPIARHKIGDKWTVNDGRRTWTVTLQPPELRSPD